MAYVDDPIAIAQADSTVRLARIDDEIAHDRVMYDRALHACHSGERAWYEAEIDRLGDLRTAIEHGSWPASVVTHTS